MPQSSIDPYAELDYRADAGELSEEFRKPVRIRLAPRHGLPGTRTGHPARLRIRV
jgi:hypothetical protein